MDKRMRERWERVQATRLERTIKSTPGSGETKAHNAELTLLKRFAWYYQINDCQERQPDDALEVPISDLREALDLVKAAGVDPAP